MLLAYLGFTCVDSSAKWLVLAGIPAFQVVFVRYAGHLLVSCILTLPREGLAMLRTQSARTEILRALCLLGATCCNFNAVKYLPLTLTTAIFFTTPLIVCILSIPMLGERIGPRRWTAILVGFAGALVATRPWGGEVHWALILSVSAALFASFYVILTRRLAGVDSTATQQFYAAALPTILIAPFALGDWTWPPDGASWFAFCAIGVFGWGGHQMLTVAHRFAPASTLAPFVYSQIIYMGAASWMIFDQPPEFWHVIGAAIILASGLYIWMREKALHAGRA